MMNIEKDLKSMGYRKMDANKWGKPVGWHLFIVEIDLLRWTNWFKGTNELFIWNSETFEESDYEDFLMFVKNCETFTKINTVTNNSEFQFLSVQEQYELML